MHDRHHDDEEQAPLFTTPQGTQEGGVEHGHEEKDVTFRPLINWFLLLGAVVIVTVFAVWLGFTFWMEHATRSEKLPSEVYASPVQPPPPLPRLLPNPADDAPGRNQAQIGPTEFRHRFQQAVDARLNQVELRDSRTGLPKLPTDAVQAVIGAQGSTASLAGAVPKAEGAPGASKAEGEGAEGNPNTSYTGRAPGEGPDQLKEQDLPTDSSGGTRMEDRLR